MENISRIKEKCVGCKSCEQSCPKHCISMVENKEGFWYPSVDEKSCIECKVCLKKCPVENTEFHRNEPHRVWAWRNKNDVDIMRSASGGAADSAAKTILQMGGVVYGAAYDEQLAVSHIEVTDEAERENLQSSKYVQSDPKDSYTKVKQRLSEGKTVLFTGTPCQIAGLYAFLGGNPENLYTVDLICHGVPSPKFFKKYLEYQNKQTADVREKMRKKYELTGKFVIGTVGKLNPPKNHIHLLQTFAEYSKKDETAMLVIAGGGELEQHLKAKAAELGVASKVIFLGMYSDIAGILQAFDAFVFPSLFEGLGLAIIEAQAAGLPCVASTAVPQETNVTPSLYFYCKFCHVSISEKDLWNGIHKELYQRLEEHKYLKKLMQKNSGNSNLETKKVALSREMEQVSGNIVRLESQKRSGYEQYVLGKLSKEKFLELKQNLENEIVEQKQEKTKKEKELALIQEELRQKKQIAGNTEVLLTADNLQQYVKKIEVDRRKITHAEFLL